MTFTATIAFSSSSKAVPSTTATAAIDTARLLPPCGALPRDEDRRTYTLLFFSFYIAAITDPTLASVEALTAPEWTASFAAQLIRQADDNGQTCDGIDPDIEAVILMSAFAGLSLSVIAGLRHQTTPSRPSTTSSTGSSRRRGRVGSDGRHNDDGEQNARSTIRSAESGRAQTGASRAGRLGVSCRVPGGVVVVRSGARPSP
jgi:hypothetical protein